MDGDRNVVAHRFQPPDHLIEILAAEYLAGVTHEEEQKLVSFIFERELRAEAEPADLIRVARAGGHHQNGELFSARAPVCRS